MNSVFTAFIAPLAIGQDFSLIIGSIAAAVRVLYRLNCLGRRRCDRHLRRREVLNRASRFWYITAGIDHGPLPWTPPERLEVDHLMGETLDTGWLRDRP